MAVPVIPGTGMGLSSALALAPVMRGLLVGLEPADQLTIAVTIRPARRALEVDPMDPMRAE